MQTKWQSRWYQRGWTNLGAGDRCKMKPFLKMKTAMIESILILECCYTKMILKLSQGFWVTSYWKPHFGEFVESRLGCTAVLARTIRSGLVAASGCDQSQCRMVAESLDSGGEVCMSLDSFVQRLCLSVLVCKWGWLGWGKDELR